MPNWVYNTMSVSGSKEAIANFKIKAVKDERDEVLSYWNFVTPPQEALDSGEYHSENGWSKDDGSYGDTENNWYNFNTREWGTKWDASDTWITEDEETHLVYSFSSPWSPPIPVFEAMTEQHPNLEFIFSWQEEQGWGGEAVGTDGIFVITKEYDIPSSHQEYKDGGNEESCICAYDSDEDDWFEDCPRPEAETVELSDKDKELIKAVSDNIKIIEISFDREQGKMVIE